MSALLESHLPGVPVRRGKVRDVYDLGDKLLLVATDRISAFDWVMPTGIPDKGRILTQLSKFWFDTLPVANHLISTDIDSIDLPFGCDRDALASRLKDAGVPTAVYYAKPLHQQTAYRHYPVAGNGLPVSDKLAARY